MKYRLWDTDINRLFGTFETEGEALAFVRILIHDYGKAYADDLALGCERGDGSFTEPLVGAALLARAAPAQMPDSPSSPKAVKLPDDNTVRRVMDDAERALKEAEIAVARHENVDRRKIG
jgi:hypothetical protein